MADISAAYDRAQVLAVHNTKYYTYLQTKLGEREAAAQILKLGTELNTHLRKAWKSGDAAVIAEKTGAAGAVLKELGDLFDSLHAEGKFPEKSYNTFKAEIAGINDLLA